MTHFNKPLTDCFRSQNLGHNINKHFDDTEQKVLNHGIKIDRIRTCVVLQTIW